MVKALISGITGQDGAYLSRFLLAKGYEVHGIKRRSSSFNTGRIDEIYDKVTTHYGDLTDPCSLIKVLDEVRPDEIYNLGAQTHVQLSFENPVYTADVNALGCLRLLEAIRFLKLKCDFYQASSSEIYGSSPPPQNEDSVHYPKSPYGVAKLAAYWFTVNYREAFGVKASNGILFNHESPFRGETFVTQKIVKGLVACREGRQKKLFLGNLEASRDWGHARDYVEAMWLIQKRMGDYVIATGESHTVREFIEETARLLNCDPWRYVEYSKDYVRPLEVDFLKGDAEKARKLLGWEPKVDFKSLVKEMVEAQLGVHRELRAVA